LKIGVLADISGSAGGTGGAGVVAAVKMVVKDAGGEVLAQPRDRRASGDGCACGSECGAHAKEDLANQ
jgi:hypothetical protein